MHVTLGGVALTVLAVAFALGHTPQPKPIVAVTQEQEETPAKKQDRLMPPRDFGIEALRSAMSAGEPKLPATTRVETPTIIPPIVQVQEDEEPAPKRRRVKTASAKRSADVCQRHGLRKVQYGKRWRCRR